MQIGWVDFSKTERDKVVSILRLLGTQTALDELGIGTVRDAFSDMLFPGISTLQTRAKYFVILPYLFAQAENHRFKHRRDVLAYIHNEEFTLVKTLVKNSGPEAYGIVGSRNMEKMVKMKPSSIYWNGLRTVGILRYPNIYGYEIPDRIYNNRDYDYNIIIDDVARIDSTVYTEWYDFRRANAVIWGDKNFQ